MSGFYDHVQVETDIWKFSPQSHILLYKVFFEKKHCKLSSQAIICTLKAFIFFLTLPFSKGQGGRGGGWYCAVDKMWIVLWTNYQPIIQWEYWFYLNFGMVWQIRILLACKLNATFETFITSTTHNLQISCCKFTWNVHILKKIEISELFFSSRWGWPVNLNDTS